jgi:membrane protease YdiL (CAAX protease family)
MDNSAGMVTEIKTPAEVVQSPPFPSIIASILWIIAFFGLQIIGIIGVTIYAMIGRIKEGQEAAALTQQEAMQMIGGIPMIWSLVGSSLLTLFFLWLYLRKKDRFLVIGFNQWSALSLKSTFTLAVLLCGGAVMFNYLYETYAIPGVELQDSLRILFESIPETFANRTLLFVTIALLAPTVEELMFRGLLQKSLSHKMPIFAAIGISSAIFAAMHMDFYAFPALFAMGAVFGYIYYRTGSLRVNILLHMINNGLALVLSWVMPS